MIKLPSGIDNNNLINDLRVFSWEASEILLKYSQILKDSKNKSNILSNDNFIQGTSNYAMHLALNYKQKPYIGIVLIPEKDELWISNGKNVWCERRNNSNVRANFSRKNSLSEFNLVTSKNHGNETLKKLIEKIEFNKITVMGSVGCKISSILRGESDIYISLSLPGKSAPKDWDFAAPAAIIKSAGGAITNLENQDRRLLSLQ